MPYLLTLILILNYSFCVIQYQSKYYDQIFLNHFQLPVTSNKSYIISRIDLKRLYLSSIGISPESNTNVPRGIVIYSHLNYLKPSLFIAPSAISKLSILNKQTSIDSSGAKGGRTLVTLECSESKRLGTRASRYTTTKNKLNTPGRLQLMKYNRYARKHTLHKEIK
ncbi:50S ribosomal protein L33 cyanelle [Babesia microti strain RI]|uniref:50S ribosomal protein L33 cyanelle n=1 Tax=Babesia microti (strain RI) TaxID=1133968 RepID=I7IP52_BABMR|nr:50S ribosomal protein L33 cyanelle [Babesia microti strain RI]CCF72695.1 50S ribosomal protein L33 cyanelle [Babesia microti strain RI]|eukprot:XP_012647304.1 50S ribosomal protein L33 cyanelle [Babesia microti strain RI]